MLGADCWLLNSAVKLTCIADMRSLVVFLESKMPSRYAQWMYDWETRLTSVDNNRVVRPMEWGLEHAREWPCRNGYAPGHAPENSERYLRDYNGRIVAASDEFYSYERPADFRLERREVQVFSTREV